MPQKKVSGQQKSFVPPNKTLFFDHFAFLIDSKAFLLTPSLFVLTPKTAFQKQSCFFGVPRACSMCSVRTEGRPSVTRSHFSVDHSMRDRSECRSGLLGWGWIVSEMVVLCNQCACGFKLWISSPGPEAHIKEAIFLFSPKHLFFSLFFQTEKKMFCFKND